MAFRRILHLDYLPLVLASGLLCLSGPVAASEPASSGQSEVVQKLIEDLDSQHFFVRELAMKKLRSHVVDGTGPPQLVAWLNQLSLDPHISFETQRRLIDVLKGVPAENKGPVEELSEQNVDSLIGELLSDRFAERESAIRQLQWFLGNQANVMSLLTSIKQRLREPATSATTRQELTQHLDLVRNAWLQIEEDKCPLPAVNDSQILAWIKQIALPIDSETTQTDQQLAIQEVQDLLIRSDCRARTATFLEKQLSETADPTAAVRIQDLLDLNRPAMVAEIWSNLDEQVFINGLVVAQSDVLQLHLVTTQYLHIGVPQLPEMATQVTHFDYCDDTRAHCVSGNTLKGGQDYPVGLAILHPEGNPTVFHLINLPTPRRRLLYEYTARRSESMRMRELTERTCDAYLSGRLKLTEADPNMLKVLDPQVVSQFAGEFFAKVDDLPFEGIGSHLTIGHTSVHGGVCYALAFIGTKDAAPGIIKALEEDRILPPDVGAYFNLPLIALLAIANRDPWESVNDWLNAQIEEDEALVSNVDPAPDLAATAAAILGERLGRSPQSLGLVPISDEFCKNVGLTTYRFESAKDRKAAKSWFRAQRQDIARQKAS